MTDTDCPACDRPADDDHAVCELGAGEHDGAGFRLVVHREWEGQHDS